MIDNKNFEKLIEALSDEMIKLGWTPPKKEECVKGIINLRLAIVNEHEMQFCDNKNFDKTHTIRIGKLDSIKSDRFVVNEFGWRYCRYIENKWLVNPNLITDTNITVVPEGLSIKALLRDSLVVWKDSHDLDFSIENENSNGDIIAYEILGTSQGWKYEWE